MSSTSDRNLLLGILALQLNFVTREQLIECMHAWVLDKAQGLGSIFLSRRFMEGDQQALLEALVNKHVEKHGGVQNSIHQLSSVDSLASQRLCEIDDQELQATLQHISAFSRDQDPLETLPLPTSRKRSASRFRIIRPHRRGGLGEVFLAEDVELSRHVALKEIQTPFADNLESRERFLREAEITGRLEHPGIVPVYGLGTYDDGRPFYAMKFVKGESLKEAIDEFHSNPEVNAAQSFMTGQVGIRFRDLLGRFVDVCNAVHYAHSRGVLHRDLKPGNVMIGEYGETLVVDWGLAKSLGTKLVEGPEHSVVQTNAGSGSVLTMHGSTMGTPSYMSPEQALGEIEQLGPATDVYSLGATLYYLLTKRAPFVGDSLPELLALVGRGEFASPRNIVPALPRALEHICLKAMSLNPQDRFESAGALANDVQRFLADEPISAHRESVSEVWRRWARKHPRTVATLSASLFVGLLGAAAFAYLIARKNNELALAVRNESIAKQAVAEKYEEVAQAKESETAAKTQAIQSRDLAQRQLTRFEKLLYARNLQAAQRYWKDGSTDAAFNALDACRWDYRGWEHQYLRESFQSRHVTLDKDSNGTVAWSPDGKSIAAGTNQETLKIWDASTGQVQRTVEGTGVVRCLTWSPDSRQLVTGAENGSLAVWDAANGTQQLTLVGHSQPVAEVSWSPDGKRIATSSYDNVIRVWDTQSGLEQSTLNPSSPVLSFAWSPEGGRIAGAMKTRGGKISVTLAVWDVATRNELLTLEGYSNIDRVRWNPDGKQIAGSIGDELIVWNASNLEQQKSFAGGSGGITDIAWCGDGKQIIASYQDGELKVWDVLESRILYTLQGHLSSVNQVCWSADGHRVAASDGELKIWDLLQRVNPVSLSAPEDWQASAIAWSPDSNYLSACGYSLMGGSLLKIWDVVKGQEQLTIHEDRQNSSIALFWRSQKEIKAVSMRNSLMQWNVETGRREEILLSRSKPPSPFMEAKWGPQGNDYVVIDLLSFRGGVVYDASSGLEKYSIAIDLPAGGGKPSFAWSPDGKYLACTANRLLKVWEAGGQEYLEIKDDRLPYGGWCAWSSDGTRIVSERDGKSVFVWDLSTKQKIVLSSDVYFDDACFSPDSTRIVTVSRADGTIRLWDAVSGQELLMLADHAGASLGAAWSPDGKRLVSFGEGQGLNVYHVESTPDKLQLMESEGMIGLGWSKDGRVIFHEDYDVLSVWDSITGQFLPDAPKPTPHSSNVSPDGKRQLVIEGNKTYVLRLDLLDQDGLSPSQRWDRERLAKWAQLNTAWHEQQAASFEQARHWFAAAFHLRLLVEHAPNDQKLHERLARAEANQSGSIAEEN